MQNTNLIDDIVIDTPQQIGVGTSKLASVQQNTNFIKLPNEKIVMNNETETEKMESGLQGSEKIFYQQMQMKKHKFKNTDSKSSETFSSNFVPLFIGDEELMMMQQQSEEKESAIDVEAGRSQSGSATYNSKVKEFIEETNKEDSSYPILPWHKLFA